MEFGFAGVGLASWMQTADEEEEGSSGLSFTPLLHCRTVVSLLFLNPQNLFQAFIIATSLWKFLDPGTDHHAQRRVKKRVLRWGVTDGTWTNTKKDFNHGTEPFNSLTCRECLSLPKHPLPYQCNKIAAVSRQMVTKTKNKCMCPLLCNALTSSSRNVVVEICWKIRHSAWLTAATYREHTSPIRWHVHLHISTSLELR